MNTYVHPLYLYIHHTHTSNTPLNTSKHLQTPPNTLNTPCKHHPNNVKAITSIADNMMEREEYNAAIKIYERADVLSASYHGPGMFMYWFTSYVYMVYIWFVVYMVLYT